MKIVYFVLKEFRFKSFRRTGGEEDEAWNFNVWCKVSKSLSQATHLVVISPLGFNMEFSTILRGYATSPHMMKLRMRLFCTATSCMLKINHFNWIMWGHQFRILELFRVCSLLQSACVGCLLMIVINWAGCYAVNQCRSTMHLALNLPTIAQKTLLGPFSNSLSFWDYW